MTLIETTDATQRIGRRLVIEMRHNGITGVSRQGDQTAFFDELAGLLEQTGLRILRMNSE